LDETAPATVETEQPTQPLVPEEIGPAATETEPPSAPADAVVVARPAQRAPAAPSLFRRIGASLGALGALIAVGGAFLPTYGSGDYEAFLLQHMPGIVFGLLGGPALLLFLISLLSWFKKPLLWLMVLGWLLIILVVWVHWLVETLFGSF